MSSKKSITNKLLLSAIFLGLNVLAFVVAHGKHVHQHTKVNLSHVSAHGAGRARSRNEQSNTVMVCDAQIDHVVVARHSHSSGSAPKASAIETMALPVVAPMLDRPTRTAELLVRENVLALGSAPRAPGLGRAPPVA